LRLVSVFSGCQPAVFECKVRSLLARLLEAGHWSMILVSKLALAVKRPYNGATALAGQALD
jgi:hypothetical protein